MLDPQIDILQPGPQLADALAKADLSSLDSDQTLTCLAAWQRMAAWAEAGALRAVAGFADHRSGDGLATELPGRERRVQLGGPGTPAVGGSPRMRSLSISACRPVGRPDWSRMPSTCGIDCPGSLKR